MRAMSGKIEEKVNNNTEDWVSIKGLGSQKTAEPKVK
jgi:hypothetical protein